MSCGTGKFVRFPISPNRDAIDYSILTGSKSIACSNNLRRNRTKSCGCGKGNKPKISSSRVKELRAQGMTYKQVAAELGFSPRAIFDASRAEREPQCLSRA
jgi:hypothetical protein